MQRVYCIAYSNTSDGNIGNKCDRKGNEDRENKGKVLSKSSPQIDLQWNFYFGNIRMHAECFSALHITLGWPSSWWDTNLSSIFCVCVKILTLRLMSFLLRISDCMSDRRLFHLKDGPKIGRIWNVLVSKQPLVNVGQC